MNSSITFDFGKYRLAGQTIAELRGDVLHKRVAGSRHMLRHPRQAWALDNTVLVDAERRGAQTVEVLDIETGQTYRAGIARFHAHGFTVDRGYGEQRALALAYWQTGDAQRPPVGVPVQLGFAF